MQGTHDASGMAFPPLDIVWKELEGGDLNMMDNSLALVLSNILKRNSTVLLNVSHQLVSMPTFSK